jgi:hypothetical protein
VYLAALGDFLLLRNRHSSGGFSGAGLPSLVLDFKTSITYCGADTRVCRVETHLDACSWIGLNSKPSVETSLDAAG